MNYSNIYVDDDTCVSKENEETNNKSGCFNKNLIFCKLFYFFYHSALGSLWPYLPLYFRQLFLTPRQTGIIVAFRTITQFIFVPLWCAVAEKYQKHKAMLIIALFAWLLSMMGIFMVPKGKPIACATMDVVAQPQQPDSTGDDWFNFSPYEHDDTYLHHQIRDYDQHQGLMLSTSNISSGRLTQYDPKKHLTDSSLQFILLVLITVVGVSLASPAQSLADISTLKRLKYEAESFGQQVIWAAVGSALFAFIIGTAVSFMEKENPCTKKADINYSFCFYSFAFFIVLAISVATEFTFSPQDERYVDLDETIATFWECVKTINDVHLASLLAVTFYCGFGNGFISTFLFWHLREMGGLQMLLALVSLTNSTAEVIFYVISDRLMGWVGHFRLIYIGLFFFSVRFFYYSFLQQPWLVLPIEVTHGLTSTAIRSAMISYLLQEGAASNILHGVFNGIHGGLGFAVGGLVGGIMVHHFGHTITFLIFAEISLLTLFCFILVNNIWPYTKHDMKKIMNVPIPPKKTNLTEMYNISNKDHGKSSHTRRRSSNTPPDLPTTKSLNTSMNTSLDRSMEKIAEVKISMKE